eukprot:646784_1
MAERSRDRRYQLPYEHPHELESELVAFCVKLSRSFFSNLNFGDAPEILLQIRFLLQCGFSFKQATESYTSLTSLARPLEEYIEWSQMFIDVGGIVKTVDMLHIHLKRYRRDGKSETIDVVLRTLLSWVSSDKFVRPLARYNKFWEFVAEFTALGNDQTLALDAKYTYSRCLMFKILRYCFSFSTTEQWELLKNHNFVTNLIPALNSGHLLGAFYTFVSLLDMKPTDKDTAIEMLSGDISDICKGLVQATTLIKSHRAGKSDIPCKYCITVYNAVSDVESNWCPMGNLAKAVQLNPGAKVSWNDLKSFRIWFGQLLSYFEHGVPDNPASHKKVQRLSGRMGSVFEKVFGDTIDKAFENVTDGKPPIVICSNHNCTDTESYVGGFRRCSGCNQAWYCSQECQKKHWDTGHRGFCKWMKRRNKRDKL